MRVCTGCTHIDADEQGRKDFSKLIACAKTCAAPKKLEEESVLIGFAHEQAMALAESVISAVKSGAVKRFVVMAGCDGRLRQVQISQTGPGRGGRTAPRARRRSVQ